MEVYKILENYVKIGTKLYSTIWGEVGFLGLNSLNNIILNAFDGKHIIYPNGKYTEKGEVILFPSKENKDWDSLIKFKKGDVICSRCFPNLLAVFDHYKYDDNTIVYSAILYSDDELKIKLDTGLGTQSNVKLTDEVGRKRMMEALDKVGYFINLHGDVVPKKFNIKELKPFDKVLVRDSISTITWRIGTYSFYDEKKKLFVCECCWHQCVPYNDDTKHLLGTDHDCPEHYKNWE